LEVNRAGRFRLASLSATLLAVLGGLVAPATAIAAPGNCIAGYVPREARPGDDVCVTQTVRDRTAEENKAAAERREPNGGVYGPNTCKQGFVWREAFEGDVVCVTPEIREQTWSDNAAAASRRAVSTTPAADSSGAVMGLINQQRAANACGPVASNSQLSSAAARHAKDMLNSGVTGHDGSDGSSGQSRVSDAGYAGTWGEIVYWGVGGGATPQAALDWWMNSPGHRAIILNCDFKDVGVAAVSANGKLASVGVFGVR
jgi:uncharacterized protein YkwD